MSYLYLLLIVSKNNAATLMCVTISLTDMFLVFVPDFQFYNILF